jgi:hypothetical protein
VCLFIKYKKERFTTEKLNIFIYWDQGWSTAPYIVKQCLKSWKKYNSRDYNIIELESSNIHKWISNKQVLETINRIKKYKGITLSSDLLRLNLLSNHGGFWIDSTILCTKPIMFYFDLLKKIPLHFYFPYDFDGKIHSYNYIYCSKDNLIFQKVVSNVNLKLSSMTNEELHKMDYLYIGFLMYNKFKEYIDWDIILKHQISKSSNNKKKGYKRLANSKKLMLLPYTKNLEKELNNEYFLKFTIKNKVSDMNSFPKNSITHYLLKKHT